MIIEEKKLNPIGLEMLEKENILFSNRINVRIDDINYGNHLCHTKMIAFIHHTRTLFLQRNKLSEIDCFGAGLIMLNLNVEYRSECFFDDTLDIYMHFEKLDKVKIEFSYSVINITTNKLAAKANTLMAFFDIHNQKLIRVPNEFKKLIDSLV